MQDNNNVWTLTGHQFQAGTAINNTQTDVFKVYGTSNYILSIGGNLTVNGGYSSQYGQDDATSIGLENAKGTLDVINLNGGHNRLGTVDHDKLVRATVNYTVHGKTGSNAVTLINTMGQTTLKLGGAGNRVTLNGDATNSIDSAGGGATIAIGSPDDNLFGNKTTIELGGTGNAVNGGDENFTIAGGQGCVTLGDGENSVCMTGSGNQVTVGGGDNTIKAGGDNAKIAILGVDSRNLNAFAAGPNDWAVPDSPTDNVTICGTNDSVTATYENVNVWGAGVTSRANITLGDGNNSIVLGGIGWNTVSVGCGANSINASGDHSSYSVGAGPNGITLSGNNNLVTVNDSCGMGLDRVQLGAGANNTVKLDHAGGSVTGTDTTGITTVLQSGWRAVSVNLNAGTGHIHLGDGCDVVTANGSGTQVTAGNGNDTITANGKNDSITLGDGNNQVCANGNGDGLKFGNGNSHVHANGNGVSMSFGSGSNYVQALGSNDNITLNAAKTSFNEVSVGDHTTVALANGTGKLTANGDHDTFLLSNTNLGTVVYANANGEKIGLCHDASAFLHLNPAGMGESIALSGSGASGHDYCGAVEMTGFGPADQLDLSKLMGANGQMLDNLDNVLANFTAGPTGETIHLHGGGAVVFDSPVTFTVAEFKFT